MIWHRADWLALGCAAILGASGVGFVIGLHGNGRIRPVVPQEAIARAVMEEVPEAIPYANIGEHSLSPNREWRNDLSKLIQPLPAVTDPSPIPRLEETIAAVLQRSQRRAYAGAPPAVPHTIAGQRSAAACLACHGEGLNVGGRQAAKISHPHYQNCTQCHVESENRILGGRAMPENTFVGLAEPVAGQKAHEKAPPTMPHPSYMREDCAACHGVSGLPGLRTSHPQRANCVQCHAVSASLDQHQAMPPGPR